MIFYLGNKNQDIRYSINILGYDTRHRTILTSMWNQNKVLFDLNPFLRIENDLSPIFQNFLSEILFR